MPWAWLPLRCQGSCSSRGWGMGGLLLLLLLLLPSTLSTAFASLTFTLQKSMPPVPWGGWQPQRQQQQQLLLLLPLPPPPPPPPPCCRASSPPPSCLPLPCAGQQTLPLGAAPAPCQWTTPCPPLCTPCPPPGPHRAPAPAPLPLLLPPLPPASVGGKQQRLPLGLPWRALLACAAPLQPAQRGRGGALGLGRPLLAMACTGVLGGAEGAW